MDLGVYASLAAARIRSSRRRRNHINASTDAGARLQMALPPLPQSNTARIKYTYLVNAQEHDLVIRVTDLDALASVDTWFMGLMSALSTDLYATTCTEVNQARIHENVFLPAPSDRIGDTWGTGAATSPDADRFISFVGRSAASGRRTAHKVFGWKGAIPPDWRYSTGERATVTAALAVVSSAPVGTSLAIDGAGTFWKQYANVKYYDGLIKGQRV